jgi:hypothetical protein
MYREDVHKPDGKIVRRLRNIRLGTLVELPTRAAAYEEFSQRMGYATPLVELKFSELVERWKAVVVPTIKDTTATYYLKTLNAHVLPAFGQKDVSDIGRYDVESFLRSKRMRLPRNRKSHTQHSSSLSP